MADPHDPTPPPADLPFAVRHAGEPSSEPPERPRRRLIRVLRDTVLSVLLIVVLWVGIDWFRAPDLPSEAPAFTLPDLDGVPVSLADYRGKTVVLNFWATWCGPCRAEIPTLTAFAHDHPDIPVLGVAVDGTVPKLKKAASELGIGYPVLVADHAMLMDYKPATLPMSVIVGPDGAVRSIHTGMMFGPYLWWVTR